MTETGRGWMVWRTQVNILPGMNAGASTYAVPSPIKGSGTAWVLLGSWALSPARPTPIHPRHECRGLSALFGEVHVNTMEGFWSLLRSWLRPHRGISQAKLPLYLGFFEFVHNARKRGKALLHALIELLV